MIIRGILDSSLNGQLCVRGFAPIKELERISKADYSYQRNPIKDREDIIEFLEKQAYLFFPEIILSYKVKHSFDDKKNQEPPLQKIQSGKNYTSSQDKTSLKVKTLDYKKTFDSSNKNNVLILEIELNDTFLNDAISKNEHPFHRIDGNHRLEAARTTDTPKVNKMVAPFCILLGEEFYANNIIQTNEATDVFNKSVKIFFHNINTKTISLTSEENLKVIIDDNVYFPDTELETILGYKGVAVREILNDSNFLKVFPAVANLLEGNERNWLLNSIDALMYRGKMRKTVIKKLALNALAQINTLLNTTKHIKVNKAIFVSLVYYFSQTDIGKADLFPSWLVSTGNGNINHITPENLIDLFEEHTSKSLNIFVAMPSFGTKEIKAYNKAYQNVVDKIKTNNPTLQLHLFPVMQHKGKSFDLSQNLFERIDKSGIVIVDVTDSNPNVMYELGYAKSANKHRIIVCEQAYFKKIPFDFEHDLRRSYLKTALTELEDVVHTDLVAILRDEYKLIIKE